MDDFWLPTRDVGKFSCLHKPFNSPSCNRFRISVGSARCEPTCTCDIHVMYIQVEFMSKYDLQDPGQNMESSMPLTPESVYIYGATRDSFGSNFLHANLLSRRKSLLTRTCTISARLSAISLYDSLMVLIQWCFRRNNLTYNCCWGSEN